MNEQLATIARQMATMRRPSDRGTMGQAWIDDEIEKANGEKK